MLALVKYLARILRRFLTALSLLLLIGVCGVWVRGYWIGDHFTVAHRSLDEEALRHWYCGVSSGRGEMTIHYETAYAEGGQARAHGFPPGTQTDTWLSHSRYGLGRRDPDWLLQSTWWNRRLWYWDHAGVIIASSERRGTWWPTMSPLRLPDGYARAYLFLFPCWLAALLFALLPSQRLYAWMRRRKARRAARDATRRLCPTCHYDLRATPDPAGPRLSKCPECGRRS